MTSATIPAARWGLMAGALICFVAVAAPGRVDPRLRAAIILYDAGNLEEARAALEEVVAARDVAAQDKVRARLYLGAAHLASGNRDQAREAVAAAVAADPTARPDPATFAPDFQAFFETVAREVRDGAKGTRGGPASKKRQLAVLDVRQVGLNERLAEAAGVVVAGETRRLRSADTDVITSSDIAAVLGFERQKQLLGCNEDASCLAEISGALGVDELLTTRLVRAGRQVIVELRLLDPKTARAIRSATRTVRHDEGEVISALNAMIGGVVSEPDAPRVVARAPPQPRADLSPTREPPLAVTKARRSSRSWILPLACGGVAAAAGAGAAYFGFAARASEAQNQSAHLEIDKLSSAAAARSNALNANIGFGVLAASLACVALTAPWGG